jgi:hypothetical protein
MIRGGSDSVRRAGLYNALVEPSTLVGRLSLRRLQTSYCPLLIGDRTLNRATR